MSNRSGFFMNFSGFNSSFNGIVKVAIPGKIEKACFDVGWIILKDAKENPPKAPRKIGDLHTSGVVEPFEFGKLGVTVGFNKEYAAKWHELPKGAQKNVTFSLPGSGRKYLETKLHWFKDKYIKFVADQIHA